MQGNRKEEWLKFTPPAIGLVREFDVADAARTFQTILGSSI